MTKEQIISLVNSTYTDLNGKNDSMILFFVGGKNKYVKASFMRDNTISVFLYNQEDITTETIDGTKNIPYVKHEILHPGSNFAVYNNNLANAVPDVLMDLFNVYPDSLRMCDHKIMHEAVYPEPEEPEEEEASLFPEGE